MEFEWDEDKNDENIVKHGFDFLDAEDIFGPTLLARRDIRFDYGEERWIGFGLLNDIVVSVVFTLRGNATRIISLRRASYHEQIEYEAFLQNRLGASEEHEG